MQNPVTRKPNDPVRIVTEREVGKKLAAILRDGENGGEIEIGDAAAGVAAKYFSAPDYLRAELFEFLRKSLKLVAKSALAKPFGERRAYSEVKKIFIALSKESSMSLLTKNRKTERVTETARLAAAAGYDGYADSAIRTGLLQLRNVSSTRRASISTISTSLWLWRR